MLAVTFIHLEKWICRRCHTIPNTSDSDIQFSFLAKLNNNPFLPCKWEYFSRNLYKLCESVCAHYYQYKASMEPIAKICYLKEILPRIMKVFVIIYIEWMFIKYQSILWYLSSLNYDLVICTQNNDITLYRLCDNLNITVFTGNSITFPTKNMCYFICSGSV